MSARVDLDAMGDAAQRLLLGFVGAEDTERAADMMQRTIAELAEYRRGTDVPASNPRLDACRDRASHIMGGRWTLAPRANLAQMTEDLAHALLAAEREPVR